MASSRSDHILMNIKRAGVGVEIGPSHRPIAPKNMGFKTHVIDHMSREDLKIKYKDANVALENIEEVDFIWRGESYAKLTNNHEHYDWVIASHVIEHVPDLIGFLSDCEAILKNDGVLSLAIPDSRFCFDHFRPLSSLGSIIDANVAHRDLTSVGTVAEFLLNAVKRGGTITWPRTSTDEFSFIHGVMGVKDAIKKVVEEGKYIDAHVWCFTPHWFRVIIDDLYALGFISMREVSFFDPGTHEFYVTLGRTGKGSGMQRLDLLRQTGMEISMADAELTALK